MPNGLNMQYLQGLDNLRITFAHQASTKCKLIMLSSDDFCVVVFKNR